MRSRLLGLHQEELSSPNALSRVPLLLARLPRLSSPPTDARIIDGRVIAETIRKEVAQGVAKMKEQTGKVCATPHRLPRSIDSSILGSSRNTRRPEQKATLAGESTDGRRHRCRCLGLPSCLSAPARCDTQAPLRSDSAAE